MLSFREGKFIIFVKVCSQSRPNDCECTFINVAIMATFNCAFVYVYGMLIYGLRRV